MMTLIQFIIALGQRLIGLTPGPGGSSLDPAFGETIATDWTKLQPAQVYWNSRFAAVNGGNPSLSPHARLACADQRSVEREPRSLMAQRDVIRTRSQYDAIVTTDDNKGRIILDLDSLVAGSEIAAFIGTSSTPPDAGQTQVTMHSNLFRALYTTTAAAASSDDMRNVGRGLRAARELLDGQRFQFARTNAAVFVR